MSSHASIQLIGHITTDLFGDHPAAETTYCKFTLAVNTRFKQEDGTWGKRGSFYRCTVWGNEATWLARDAKKGALVFVAGEPYQEDYVDKEGVKKTSFQHVRCATAQFLRQRGDEAAPCDPPPPVTPKQTVVKHAVAVDNPPPF